MVAIVLYRSAQTESLANRESSMYGSICPTRHYGVVNETERTKNKTKSTVRAKVEHAIGVLKRIFGFVKVRYRGLEKNANRLFVICALANLSWHDTTC